MKSLLRIALGLFLLMIGIIGLFIPLLQGVLIILIAIPILSPKHGKLMVAKIKQWCGLAAALNFKKRKT